MSSVITKKLLEKRLMEVSVGFATAFESVAYTPVANVPYQRVVVLPRAIENPTMGDEYYREVGSLQVFLCYPLNQGTAVALARAETIRNYFKRGTTLTESNVRINIVFTPSIRGSSVAGDRLVLPVVVDYTAEILA